MQTNLMSDLFSDLSPEAASQTKGGSGYSCSSRVCHPSRSRSQRIIVRVRQSTTACCSSSSSSSCSPCSSSSSRGGSINITNPDIDDGAIVNFPCGSNINMTNPDIDDGAIVNFI